MIRFRTVFLSEHIYLGLGVLFVFLTTLVAGDISAAADMVQSLKSRALRNYKGIGVPVNYRRALALYLKAAGLGDSDSQYISGAMLVKGMGGRKDRVEGLRLILQAAEQGKSTPESERILGEAYLLGDGVPKNYTRSLKWYRLSAEHGDREAMNELGFMYFTGKGGERDLEKGAYYFEKAAHKGLVVAQYNTGIMYLTGDAHGDVDVIKSYGWLNLAASKGNRQAAIARNYLETLLTGAEIERAQEYSRSLSQKIGTTSP